MYVGQDGEIERTEPSMKLHRAKIRTNVQKLQRGYFSATKGKLSNNLSYSTSEWATLQNNELLTFRGI
jgi:hypothetical protein